jgi:hypothetical protein
MIWVLLVLFLVVSALVSVFIGKMIRLGQS